MSFSEVLEQKISELEKDILRLKELSSNPDFYYAQAAESLAPVLQQIEALPDDPDVLKKEIGSIVSQIPALFRDLSLELQSTIRKAESNIVRWREMDGLYKGWEEENAAHQAALLEHEESLKQSISEGVIEEPSKKTAIRRERGTRPPLSLSQYRRLSKELRESGEDSEG